MGIQKFVNVIRKSRKSLLHLAMLTSIVAAAAVTFPPSVTAAASPSSTNHHQSQPDQHQEQPYDSQPNHQQQPYDSQPHHQQQQQQQQQRARPAIPYCNGKHDDRTISRRLLYVTTLDGRISALDIAKGGKLRWSIQTGPGPLISSSIHRLELTNNGRFVRMIPSLSGGIYKFDGKSIDPIPITTENLLSSSAKFSDDLVVSGGKETRTYGVSARTGQLLYECSMHGCINATDAVTSGPDKYRDAGADEETNSSMPRAGGELIEQHDPLLDDVIVVRRHTQTVRAVESRTGVERWNFSVGQHELNMIRSEECHDRQLTDFDMAINDLDIKVIVPEGVICAFSKTNPNSMLWKYKFDHPIVSGWKMGESADELQPIDMFGSAQWLWDSDDNIFESPYPTISPSIYLGMYDKQLYIQESIKIRREIDDQSNLYTHLTSGEESMPSIPWRPIPASSSSLVVFQGATTTSPHDGGQVIQGHELVPYDEDNFAVSALSVLNASEYVNGNGFYLYTSKELNESGDLCDEQTGQPAITDGPATDPTDTAADDSNGTHKDELDFNFDDLDAPVKVVVLSLWYWWKEILVIAFTSALVFNFFLTQRHRPQREIVVIERHIPVPTAIEATEASTVALLGPVVPPGGTTSKSPALDKGLLANRSLSESTSHSGEHYTSRFQGDFDLLRCLGRGGFGVVFETKNKLDDCKYAVKRITLPNKKESRDRVMREVKTLANCEHQNIVRYFQAWVETPPPGWQEEEDSKWLAHEMSTSIQIETPDGTTLPSFASGVQAVEHANGNHLLLDKKKQLLSWVSSVTSVACSSDHEDHNCIQEADENDYGGDDDEDEDSSILFLTESQSKAHRDESSSSSSNSSSSSSDDEAGVPRYRRTKAKPKPRQIRQIDDAVAIDIHSHSFDAKIADYSQLSDSFQIEFVRPADEQHAGDDDDDDDGFSEEESTTPRGASTTTASASDATNKTKIMQRQKLALDLTNNNNNRTNGKAVAASSSRTPPTKPSQNRLYLYIQMQLCRKESLRDWLRENTTALRESHIASIFHQIVDAVDYVHFKGLIHRDLKPSNIFFSQDGQIKIGDFGLVTDMSDIPNLVTKCGDTTGLPSCSRHTQQVGTHLYMSPEQLRGLHYDYKVDIYSLGLIFFELLVFFGTEMERIVTLRDLRVGKYPEKFPLAHPDEYALLQRMLSPNPDERPATPELKRELSTILRLPEVVGDSEAAALAAAARRLSRSRTFSMNE